MVVNKTTTPQLVIKPLQFIEESVEGTTPGSGSLTAIGPCAMVSVKKGGQFVEIPQLGSEDLVGLTQGPQLYDFQIKYNPTSSYFLKYGVNSANYGTSSSTISKSLTILFSIWFNNVENYIVFKGVRFSQVTLDFEVGKPIVISGQFKAMNIVAPSSSAPAGVTLVTTTPTGPVWDWLSGGANPLSYNSTGQDCKKFSVTINRNTKEDYTLGNVDPFGLQPHGRRIAINGDFLWDSTSTFETDYKTPTAQTIAIVLKTAVSTLTITSSQVTDYNRDTDITQDMAVVETITGKGLTVSIT